MVAMSGLRFDRNILVLLQLQYNDLRIRFVGQWQWVPIQFCILLAVPGVLSESSPESELIVDSYLSFATGSEA